ncbi:MAG: uroporphyrinogen decarboxylase family protein [Pseudomonadota bacterium]
MTLENGRELFDLFLKRRPLTRPVFLPLIRGLMARVGGSSVEALTSDPTIWANTLLRTAELFDLDGLVTGFHFSLMAEACGCGLVWENDRPVILPRAGNPCEEPEKTRRLANALEAAGRVIQVCRPKRAVAAAVAGPLTLRRHVFPDDVDEGAAWRYIKGALARAVEAFCAKRPDAFIFMEGLRAGEDIPPQVRRIYSTLKNIVSHYGVVPGLYVQGHDPTELARLTALEMEVYVLGPDAEGRPPGARDLWNLGASSSGAGLGVGLGLPVDDPDLAQGIIEEGLEYYRAQNRVGFFYTSIGPLTRQADPEKLHDLVGRIRRARV